MSNFEVVTHHFQSAVSCLHLTKWENLKITFEYYKDLAIAIAIAIDLKPAVILPIKDAGGGYKDPGGLVDKFHRLPNVHLRMKLSQNLHGGGST